MKKTYLYRIIFLVSFWVFAVVFYITLEGTILEFKSLDEGIENNNCINTFVEYDRVLNNRHDYYDKKYGLIPEFKAGVNLGQVTVAEVGELKKELAYHGDVLNTAARIEGKCNELQKRLLLSENVKNRFDGTSMDNFELIDNIQLRGKEKLVNIYGVKNIEV